MQLFILLFLIFLTRKRHFSDNSGDKLEIMLQSKAVFYIIINNSLHKDKNNLCYKTLYSV